MPRTSPSERGVTPRASVERRTTTSNNDYQTLIDEVTSAIAKYLSKYAKENGEDAAVSFLDLSEPEWCDHTYSTASLIKNHGSIDAIASCIAATFIDKNEYGVVFSIPFD